MILSGSGGRAVGSRRSNGSRVIMGFLFGGIVGEGDSSSHQRAYCRSLGPRSPLVLVAMFFCGDGSDSKCYQLFARYRLYFLQSFSCMGEPRLIPMRCGGYRGHTGLSRRRRGFRGYLKCVRLSGLVRGSRVSNAASQGPLNSSLRGARGSGLRWFCGGRIGSFLGTEWKRNQCIGSNPILVDVLRV